MPPTVACLQATAEIANLPLSRLDAALEVEAQSKPVLDEDQGESNNRGSRYRVVDWHGKLIFS